MASIGLEIALSVYPSRTNGTLFPVASDNFPKYPLLNPDTASANPSSIPMKITEKPIVFK